MVVGPLGGYESMYESYRVNKIRKNSHIRTETIEFKIKVIEAAKQIGKKPTSRLFNCAFSKRKNC